MILNTCQNKKYIFAYLGSVDNRVQSASCQHHLGINCKFIEWIGAEMVQMKNNVWRALNPSPPQIIALSFAAMIFVGTLLLNLPMASQNGHSVGLLNAFFTAVSANCVTGLVVVSTFTQWTMFGKIVILILIQLGGLGFFTIMTIFLVFLRKNITLENRLILQASFSQDNVGGMVRLAISILKITLIAEGIGAALLTLGFYFSPPYMSLPKSIGYGIFHAVSAFCNAGFDLIGDDSLAPYRDNYYINAVMIVLIICGGLGFMVWGDLVAKIRRKKTTNVPLRWAYLSLHSKMAIVSTVFLLFLGTAVFLMFEWNNPQTLAELSFLQKLQAALFQSITLRTCGFYTIAQGNFTEPSQLFSTVLMLIGGSPSGTAGGMKTVTMCVVFCAMISLLRGRDRMEAFGRSLPMDLLQKALAVIMALVLLVIASTLILYYTESGSAFSHSILDLWFEAASAAGTVGLTTGITPHLSAAGKVVIALCMFIGRIGPVTALVALNMRLRHNRNGIQYPEERVVMG